MFMDFAQQISGSGIPHCDTATRQLSARCASVTANVYLRTPCSRLPKAPGGREKRRRAMNRAEHNPSSFAAHEAFGRIPSNLRTPEKQRASASVTVDLFPPVALAEAPSQAAL